jgi:rare lipoprotein A
VTAARLLLLAPLLLVGCGPRKAAQAPSPHYVVGPAYQAGGVWRYPAEDFQLDTTGLATLLPDRTGPTADGEAYDAAAMAAAHPTLQLPAVAVVTNLETGAQVVIRINNRGPDNPARLIGLTRGAAERLGVGPEGVARVRVRVLATLSQALRDEVGGGPVGIVAAPVGAVSAVALAPPPGVGQSSRGRLAPGMTLQGTLEGSQIVFVPERIPERVTPNPGQLWIRAGEFGLRRYADKVSSRLGGLARVETAQAGRGQVFRVRAGPYRDVAAADMALDRAVRAGLTDAHIVVE